jgi:hypothetical protein
MGTFLMGKIQNSHNNLYQSQRPPPIAPNERCPGGAGEAVRASKLESQSTTAIRQIN